MTGALITILGAAILIGGAVATRVATDENDRLAAGVGITVAVIGGGVLATSIGQPLSGGAGSASLMTLVVLTTVDD